MRSIVFFIVWIALGLYSLLCLIAPDRVLRLQAAWNRRMRRQTNRVYTTPGERLARLNTQNTITNRRMLRASGIVLLGMLLWVFWKSTT